MAEPAQPTDDWLDLGPVADLPDPGSRGFGSGDGAGFIVRRGELIRAYRDRCPHIGAPLAWQPDRYLDHRDELIQCTMHGALFVIDDGECVHGPCLGAHLVPLPIAVRDGRVWLDPAADDDD